MFWGQKQDMNGITNNWKAKNYMNGSYGWMILGMHGINGVVNALWLQTEPFLPVKKCSQKIVSDKN